MTTTYEAVLCPADNCEGYLCMDEDGDVLCDYGHLTEATGDGYDSVPCPVEKCDGSLKNTDGTVRCERGHLIKPR
jgi:hypothetical protein